MDQVIESLGVDGRMMLFSTINFLGVFVLLKIFLFGRIGKFLENRRGIIQKSLDDAEKVSKNLAEAEKEKEKIIMDASTKANNIVNTANEESDKIVSDAKNDALEEAKSIEEKAKRKLEIERAEMIKELKRETADLAIVATEKILDEKLDADTDKKLIEKYLDKLGEEK